jgi:RHS repeat-associated protein
LEGSGEAVVQENAYYPFGAPVADLSWSPKSTNRYLREGKEYISDFDWNKYDFTGRTFDSWTLRALQVDPMATKYYNTSPYVLWVNNPLRVIDPTGWIVDWYEDLDKTMQFDPKVKSQKDLKDGQRYVGETYQIRSMNGKITEDYRADGSIMFANEASGYSRLWNNSVKTGNEEMGIITDNGVLVLPNYKNDDSTIPFPKYGYSSKNGNIVDADGTEYNTVATVHTHPNGSGPSLYMPGEEGGWGDLGFAANRTPNKPVFVLRMNGVNKIGLIMSASNNGHLTKNFNQYTVQDITGGIYNIYSIQQKTSLREFARKYSGYLRTFYNK